MSFSQVRRQPIESHHVVSLAQLRAAKDLNSEAGEDDQLLPQRLASEEGRGNNLQALHRCHRFAAGMHERSQRRACQLGFGSRATNEQLDLQRRCRLQKENHGSSSVDDEDQSDHPANAPGEKGSAVRSRDGRVLEPHKSILGTSGIWIEPGEGIGLDLFLRGNQVQVAILVHVKERRTFPFLSAEVFRRDSAERPLDDMGVPLRVQLFS